MRRVINEIFSILRFFRRRFFLGLLGLWLSGAVAGAGGSWTPLASSPPVGVNNCLLMSDGTVLGMNGAGQCVKLTPDSHGSYVNGTWTTLATMINSRLFFSSQLLTNGDLWVAGGEDGSGGSSAEWYDPLGNVWTLIPAPAAGYPNFADSISEILPDGNPLVCPVYTTTACLIYNVVSNNWAAAANCNASQDESDWVKLPGDSLLTIDAFSTNSEHYVPALNEWVTDGGLPVPLFDSNLGEIGSGHLLPNGRVFYLGSTSNTALYTPGATVTNAGSWVAGPPMVFGTNQLGASDAPAAMLVNGKVLCCLGPAASYNGPSSFYEYDYAANTFTAVGAPGGGGTLGNTAPFGTSMLDLPDGTVLFLDGQNTGTLYVYTPDGSPLAAGQPVIDSLTQNADGSYLLTGTGLNGISEGAAYGDDEQMNGNYPLVRLTNNVTGNVYYARTYNWSSTGVQTGGRVVTTEFALPPNLPAGSYSLVVAAVGNPSAPVAFTNLPPVAPTGLTGTAGNAQAVLSWNAVPGATAYNLKRLTTLGTPYYATVATVAGTSCTNLGLVNAFTYAYVVTAVSPGGESAGSAALMLTPAGPPPVPAGVTATAEPFTRIYLAWNASFAATNYNIKRALVHNGPYTNVASTGNAYFTDAGLLTGTNYYYVISAVSPGGESSNSGEVGALAQTVVNYSFEQNVASSGTTVPAVPAGWTAFNEAGGGDIGSQNAGGVDYTVNHPLAAPAAGNQYCYINMFSSGVTGVLYQDAGVLRPNTTYTLTVAIGSRHDRLNSPGIISLLNGTNNTGTVLVSGGGLPAAQNTWQNYTVTYATGTSVSGDLIVALSVAGNGTTIQADFDNVQLTATPVAGPPPPPTVANFSFELNAAAGAGGVVNTVPSGWTAFNEGGASDIGSQAAGGVDYTVNNPLAAPAAGNQYCYINMFNPGVTGGLYQDVGALQPNTTYTLTVAIGSRHDRLNSRGIISLLNGTNNTGTVLASGGGLPATQNVWQNYTVTHATGTSVNGDLTLALSVAGNGSTIQADFDNVQLTATPVAPTLPVLGAVRIVGGNLILTGSGGTPNSGYTWLVTTNLTAPVNWTTNRTGTLDGTGAFSNAIPINVSQQAGFFQLRLP